MGIEHKREYAHGFISVTVMIHIGSLTRFASRTSRSQTYFRDQSCHKSGDSTSKTWINWTYYVVALCVLMQTKHTNRRLCCRSKCWCHHLRYGDGNEFWSLLEQRSQVDDRPVYAMHKRSVSNKARPIQWTWQFCLLSVLPKTGGRKEKMSRPWNWDLLQIWWSTADKTKIAQMSFEWKSY